MESAWRLGRLFKDNDGELYNPTSAARWFTVAAEAGHEGAMDLLVPMLVRGEGVEKDIPQALKWCTKMAENGHALAQAYLAHIYLNGINVPKDVESGRRWLTQLIEQDNQDARAAIEHFDLPQPIPKHSFRNTGKHTGKQLPLNFSYQMDLSFE